MASRTSTCDVCSIVNVIERPDVGEGTRVEAFRVWFADGASAVAQKAGPNPGSTNGSLPRRWLMLRVSKALSDEAAGTESFIAMHSRVLRPESISCHEIDAR